MDVFFYVKLVMNFHILYSWTKIGILEGRMCTDEGFSSLISEEECFLIKKVTCEVMHWF